MRIAQTGETVTFKAGEYVTVRKIVDIYRRQKNKNSPLAFVLPWF